MICPKCEYEFIEGITKCPECNVNLVQLNEFEGGLITPSDYIVIYSCEESYEAEMLKTNLESAGIDVKILSQKDSSFPMPGDFSVIKILVKNEDADAATEIITQINNNINLEEEEEEE